ncbi:MAG: hypothetical protein JW709_02900 [Sedimentisphaerales bacterium]|nr:hypothetical protein [Sedimentisphaerales bacterium]
MSNRRHGREAYTLIEAMAVLTLMALVVGLLSVPVISRIRQAHFLDDVDRFARTLRRTAEQAVLTGQPYTIVVEVEDGYYTVYPGNDEDIYDPEESETLIDEQILDKSYIVEIETDEGDQSSLSELLLKVGPSGWRSTVTMALKDLDDRDYYIRCDRETPRVTVSMERQEIPEPMMDVDMTTPL